ncbi:hypothetical protein JWG39_01445 [Desulforhopalus vacuolatus]|uniref:hypothetical protein n=1 Tax=Desulforhopalus vacuolatus TaxID=40414 RepID=UPI00196421FE|nr:hypothetical protein [Desulforhopalus vacuolatus]MBM9518478.1 hypothetical protein [Desulforhopalus vacuolatus]
MHFPKQLKSWIFPACAAAACIVVWIMVPEKIVPVLRIIKTITLQMAIPLLISLFMMFLLNMYISTASITRLMGKKGGLSGILFSSIAGIVSMGPVFAWFPFLKALKEKGMADVYLANFLSCRAVKPVLFPVLITYFGWRFSLVFITMSLAIAWGTAFIFFLSGKRLE